MPSPCIEIQEGSVLHLMQQLKTTYGGEILEQSYQLNHPSFKAEIRYIRLTDGIEITINSFKFSEDHKIIFYGNEEGNRHLCFRFSYQGDFLKSDQFLKNGTTLKEGMAIFDTALTVELNVEKGQNHQWVGVRISKEILLSNFLKFEDYFGNVFDRDKVWIMFDNTPLEGHLLLKEMFEIKEKNNQPIPVQNAFIIAKVSELIGIFYQRILNRNISNDNYVHQQDLEALFKIKDQVIGSLEQPPSLEEIAQQYGFSVSKLRRDFEKVFGTTIHRFHQNYRLEQAKILLSAKNKTITEVSRICGYKSMAKFSYAFKNKFDVAPSEFILK
ncbi:helix-turn-helix transcriptional regulator [Flammeovirga pacifica]|uniref:HTH araC/xylS-type domain-containing protein n=1 Tax=Flammeovirga pacifica TaxID=915059 RepID=A0A1S1YZG4_FLAPC|nr:AraC family transcriptional regulator [Flammeovirga pacifica]OHX66388.1 hypothetical protein NH26_08490 [Flammeovirga pacifica]